MGEEKPAAIWLEIQRRASHLLWLEPAPQSGCRNCSDRPKEVSFWPRNRQKGRKMTWKFVSGENKEIFLRTAVLADFGFVFCFRGNNDWDSQLNCYHSTSICLLCGVNNNSEFELNAVHSGISGALEEKMPRTSLWHRSIWLLMSYEVVQFPYQKAMNENRRSRRYFETRKRWLSAKGLSAPHRYIITWYCPVSK